MSTAAIVTYSIIGLVVGLVLSGISFGIIDFIERRKVAR